MVRPMDHQTFRAAFESCSLDRDDWDHVAHLRLAWLYLGELDLDAAVARMRAGIFAYDKGTDRLCNYHESMTRFWLTLIDQARRRAPAGEDFEAFLARNPRLTDKTLILEYYHHPTIVDERARKEWVPPDKKPL